jgi:ligand-binding sensor domain-containing protein/signal transduction histidine kinase
MKNRTVNFVYLLIIISAFFPQNASSQPYYFRHYQVENGLSNNTVYFIRQDSKGFMWFATKDGLNRFDGTQFKVFRVHTTEDEKHLRTDYIYCILPGKDGTLWVGAQRGLYLFDPTKERLEPVIDSLTNIYDITIDREGKMWFISNNTLCTFDLKTKSLQQFDPSRYFPATSVCLSNDGTICASTENGFIQIFDKSTLNFRGYNVFSHSKNPASKWIQKIRAGKGKTIFIGTTSQGLKLFDPATSAYKDILTYNPDKTAIFVRDILKTKDNEFWVATETGIFIYNTETKTFTNLKKKYQDPYSLDDNAVYALFKDQEGSVWAGTFFGGINFYAKQNTAFRKYFPGNNDNPINGNAVREICKDKYRNLWVGTEDGGLNKISFSTGKLKNFKPTGEKNSIAYSNIHGLMADGDDLWIGTFEHGIDVMDIPTGKIKKHFSAGNGEKDLQSNFALCFYKTSGGQILVGTTNGLYYYHPKTNEFIRPVEIPRNIFITGILEDHEKIIWVSTNDNGVFWFDPVSHKHGHFTNEVSNKNSLSNNYVNDVFEDSNNNIWFATEGGGLCSLNSDRTKFKLFTTKNGLPSNFVFKVLEDDNKNLWASTSGGLVNFKPGFKDPVVFTRANGLLNNQFNYHSGYKDKDGRLYFGSVKGMVSFMPDEILKSNFLPPVYVTGMQVFNADLSPKRDSSVLKKTIVCSDKITLPYYESSVSFDFAALSYISPEMTSYQYKLEGLDKDWTMLKSNRKVYFTNLSPGKYIFKIKASINDLWSDKNEKELTIIITPPIWATASAYLIYVLLGILIFSYIISNYHKRQHAKKEKEIYESKIDFFTNVAHEIRTPVTLIKGPVENILEKRENMPDIKEDLMCLDRNTNRLINLVSQILDFRQTEIKSFTLDFRKVNINEILNETFVQFKIMAQRKNLNYQLILPSQEVQTLADAEALQKIFSNLIDNAVKYATHDVIIKLYPLQKNTDALTIKFENDGYIITNDFAEKIFEPFYRIKEMHHQKGTGIGLTLTKSLVELHNGTLKLTFSNKDFNTFLLSLPLKILENKKINLFKEQSLL